MQKLNIILLDQVGGGAFQRPITFAPLTTVPRIAQAAAAGAAGLGTFNGGAAIVQLTTNNIQTLNNIGAKMGEAAFNAIHPDPLGQMVFTK